MSLYESDRRYRRRFWGGVIKFAVLAGFIVATAIISYQVGIEDLRTATREAPMAGGMLFEATATLLAPPTASIADLQVVLEELANELMVDLSLSAD